MLNYFFKRQHLQTHLHSYIYVWEIWNDRIWYGRVGIALTMVWLFTIWTSGQIWCSRGTDGEEGTLSSQLQTTRIEVKVLYTISFILWNSSIVALKHNTDFLIRKSKWSTLINTLMWGWMRGRPSRPQEVLSCIWRWLVVQRCCGQNGSWSIFFITIVKLKFCDLLLCWTTVCLRTSSPNSRNI